MTRRLILRAASQTSPPSPQGCLPVRGADDPQTTAETTASHCKNYKLFSPTTTWTRRLALNPAQSPKSPLPVTLTEEEREIYEERAAILEFDAVLPRATAERDALRDVLARRTTAL